MHSRPPQVMRPHVLPFLALPLIACTLVPVGFGADGGGAGGGGVGAEDAGTVAADGGDASVVFDAGAGGAPGTIDPSGAIKTSTWVDLSSPKTGTLPFSFGIGFKKGDVPGTFALDTPDAQVEVKRRWPDGSAKHAIVTGTTTFTAGVAKRLKVIAGSYAVTNPLTCNDIAAAAPSATVSLGANGTVSLASLLAKPTRTWLSGDQAVECHYAGRAGALLVSFHVRLHRGGATFVRVIVENGWLDAPSPDLNYTPSVIIGGAAALPAKPIAHTAHSRWVAEKWLGIDPEVTPRHDTVYLRDTRLVPNYWRTKKADATKLDALTQTYEPMSSGEFSRHMSDTGYQEQIGLLPNHDALYVMSDADPRAFRSVVANGKALASFPVVWRDSADSLPTRPSGRAHWTVNGPDQGGENGVGVELGGLYWEVAHHPSGGYLAYLITGEYVFLETMQHQASTVYLVQSTSTGYGTSRQLRGQTRGSAWSLRTVGQLAAIGPTGDGVTDDYRELVQKNGAALLASAQLRPTSVTGLVYVDDLNLYGPATLGAWQANFLVQSIGHLSDLEPLADMTDWNRLRDYVYRLPVGMLGDGSSRRSRFAQAGKSRLILAPAAISDLSQQLTNWGDIYRLNFGTTPCTNTLGFEPSWASTNYWGNMLPALSHAVDHGAPGAQAAFTRLRGASNWQEYLGADWGQNAPLGVVPRNSQL